MDYVRLGDLITAAPIVKCGDGTYPVLSMTMHDGIMLQSDRFKKSLASINQSNYKVVSNGQLVIGFPIDEGVLYVQRVVDKGIMSPAYNVWDINTNLVIPEYLELALHSPFAMEYYKSKLRGTTARRRTLPTNELLALPVILPNFDVQKKIIYACNKAASLIALRKEQLAKLDQLVKSRFIELFGDPVSNPMGWDMPLIEDVVTKEKNALKAGPFGSALKKEYYVSSGYKIYGQEQVISGDHTFGDYYIDEERYQALQNCAVQAGDVLISLVGTYGKLLVMPEEFEPGIINPRLMKITFDKKKVNPYYFQYYFQSDSLKKALAENTHGGTMDILNLGIVRKLAMPVPPLELQDAFITFVEQTNKSKLSIQQSLDKLELLKKSLMQEYFG